ncbi:hypothetical protein AKJ41_02520 [candidate division MSBL1 archaeon SCGC-AAA259O05]|uniref:Metallo-beta-lactamase domain-containing protein n=1 Tax=candidate division MSBL1 archaeon SCGC-AAA259O05 TaxID=1698271 RepID=A0A133V414_9EURY|nr:hypothetical protein AKJ41_02520 [candidate division MSBL1 archaeon SCGC-AAA259O05]
MKVKWHGDASIEIFGDLHVLEDPNPVVPVEEESDVVLLTHEHDDHFDREAYEKLGSEADLYAPGAALDKFELDGEAVEPGDKIEGEIKVLESDCWNSDESVSYFYNGVLHSGDSASFPNPKGEVGLVFSACFPVNYDDYIEEFRRLEPELVIPFHYNPGEGDEDARGLKQRLDDEGIPSRVLEAGESVEISG